MLIDQEQGQWWTATQLDAVKQELARPGYRRSALENAHVRYRGLRNVHMRRVGTPYPTFPEWCTQEVSRRDGNLTQEIVRELLDYDPLTGALTWKRRDRKWFRSDRHWTNWNSKFAGKPALNAVHGKKGYLHGGIFYRLYKAHHVIFFWMTGRWPDPQVDHENHDTADNKWSNIVEATNHDNSKNQSLFRTNKSGHTGVSKVRNRWRAKIGVNRAITASDIHLGYFDAFDEACAARKAAERKYGFHPNHGKPKVR
jgi:HNH endonuclease